MPSRTLYRHPLSGHSHRVELMLSLLQLDVHLVDIDLLAGEQKQTDFLEMNPLGLVPVLVDGEDVICDSNGILIYLAKRYDDSNQWLPQEPAAAAAVQQWLGIAADTLVHGPAKARLAYLFGFDVDGEQATDIAHDLFAMMNTHLAQRTWLAAEHVTIADVAMYTYTAHAGEGRISLELYPHIQAWLRCMESLKGYCGMPKMPLPETA